LFQRDEDFSASWPTDDEWSVTEVWSAVLCQLIHAWWVESNRSVTSWPTDDERRVTEAWPAVLCQLTHGWWGESNRSLTSCALPADPRVISGEWQKCDPLCSANWHTWWLESNRNVISCGLSMMVTHIFKRSSYLGC
jgi:hypothetical protein